MRVLVKVRCTEEPGDMRRANRILLRRTRECLSNVDAEAVYFGFHGERKAAYLVLSVPGIEKLPDSVEPLCLNWNVDSHFAPVTCASAGTAAASDNSPIVDARDVR